MKLLMTGIVFLLLAVCVSADGLNYHRNTASPYTLAMRPSGYAPRMVMGLKQVSPSGPYFDPNNRGSRVTGGFAGYVPDTYSLHRPGAIVGPAYGNRMPGLPFRTTANRISYGG